MPQESAWTAQAAVLRQALAEQGLELAPPQALKVLHRMRGHPTWQALGGALSDLPASRPASLTGAVSPSPGAPEGSRVFVFEVRGTAAAGALPGGATFGDGAAWEAVRRQAGVLGFSALEQLAVRVVPTASAEAGCAVSMVVRLVGVNGLSQLGAVPANLARLLEQLAVPACRGADGVDRVTRYAWKLVAIETHGAC